MNSPIRLDAWGSKERLQVVQVPSWCKSHKVRGNPHGDFDDHPELPATIHALGQGPLPFVVQSVVAGVSCKKANGRPDLGHKPGLEFPKAKSPS
jgi:hypothetical protein